MRYHIKIIRPKIILPIFLATIILYITLRKKQHYNLENYHNTSSNLTNKVDWHDRAAMAADKLKVGVGEQGEPAYLPQHLILNETIPYTRYGYNAHLSDLISLSRSVPDVRHPECDGVNYLSQLPSASVIIPFHNEHWSVLLRSVYSILHRSPPELIHEIILVDDYSNKDFLGEKLDTFLAQNLSKVKIVRHKERKGLIAARLYGATIATGEVLVILDSHVEPNYNWLPPLLEPIAYNPKIAVCPLIDKIFPDTFQFIEYDRRARGAFDWGYHYYRFPLLPDDIMDSTKPYFSPVMKGGLFAINRKWFWELGGYDPGLDIWGGEQFELSFKIWMCGGKLMEAPCSRVGHVYRGNRISKSPRKINYVAKNYKRVAEVWMDEYAKIMYDRRGTFYDTINAGDLSDRRALRKRLNCKSFDWYMKNIAFDVLKYYPPVDPPSYANGAIRTMANENLCLDTINHHRNEEPGLHQCTFKDPKIAIGNQDWELSSYKYLKSPHNDMCLHVYNINHHKNGKVTLCSCCRRTNNQVWFYDHVHKLLKLGLTGYCMEANIKEHKIYINKCDKSNIKMKWKFSFYNATALKNFYKDEVIGFYFEEIPEITKKI